MATFSRRERTHRTVEFVVPAPTTWVELDKAAGAAWTEFVQDHGRNPCDDELSVVAEDHEIVIKLAAKT